MVGYVIYSPTQGFYAYNDETETGYFVTGDDFDSARVYSDESMAEAVSDIVSSFIAQDASVQGMHFDSARWVKRMFRLVRRA